ncbi:MAG: HEAT repeat domain-containing protein [Planctomycetes bacterium]|nr:HEAT repeat domain-containing protein [Planctomycetota bacterium]
MLWVFITVAAVGLFWIGFRNPYRRRWLLPRQVTPRSTTTSAVDRQHRHLLAGGRLGETAVIATAAHFKELFRAGKGVEVERELKPGVGFAVQIRALAAVGTVEAGRVLERQLGRQLTHDPIEQTWYWADVAAGLRHLHHTLALPAVLRCVDAASGLPAGTVLAAEAVAFPNFASTLNDLRSPVGKAALRAIVAVCRGCRDGTIDPGCMLRAGLGDLLATLSETAPQHPDPWLTAAMLETERVFRRLGNWVQLLDEEMQTVAEHQGVRLYVSSHQRAEWLAGAMDRLLARFAVASSDEQTAILRCAFEFRADVTRLFPHLPDTRNVWWADAIRSLTWSKSPSAGPVLAAQAARWLESRRSRRRIPHLLAALRGHAGPDSEGVLLRAVFGTEPEIRRAAVGSLGWWPPHDPAATMRVLRILRTDTDDETRLAAVSALARLGERAALAEVLAGLAAEEPTIQAATIARVAADELSWLWPDLQDLAESGDREMALAAAEAIHQMREHVLGPTG